MAIYLIMPERHDLSDRSAALGLANEDDYLTAGVLFKIARPTLGIRRWTSANRAPRGLSLSAWIFISAGSPASDQGHLAFE